MDRNRVGAAAHIVPRRSEGVCRTILRSHPHPTVRVLVVDEDSSAADSCAEAFGPIAEVVSVRTGREALYAARQDGFGVIVVDLQLPDMTGVAMVRELRAGGITTPFLVVTGSATVPTTVEAMRLGAAAVLEKPVPAADLAATLRSALELTNRRAGERRSAAARPASGPRSPSPWHDATRRVRSTAERWAAFVLGAIESDSDPKTLAAWARSVHVSRSVLAECCRLVRLSPHDARDFARMLRTVLRSGEIWQPEAIMDVADTRTLKKLLAAAGIVDTTRVPTVEEFFDRQRWIPADNPGLQSLRALVAGEPQPTVSRTA